MYDVVIIGCGPAGITAGIYAACYRMNAVIIGKLPGGEMLTATRIINYPGYAPVSGQDLTGNMIKQLKELGQSIVETNVLEIQKTEGGFLVKTEDQKSYESKTVIAATGTERRKLNIPGEKELTGKGVFYCATCDAHYYDGKTVCVIGGSNAAVQAAVQLSDRASRVYIIYRGEELRADPIWIEEVTKHPKIEVFYKTNITGILGAEWVTGVILDHPYQEKSELPLEGVFVEIGGIPGTSFLIPLGVMVDEKGFIEIDNTMATTVEGIYAAGDCTSTGNMLQQISVCVGEGAKAAGFVYKSLKSIRPPALWGKLWTQL